MKIALALSVNDGKGAVSSLASHRRSCDGSDCLRYRAAWASGPEKSRHFIHTVSSLEEALQERGLEARGTGGGCVLEVRGMSVSTAFPFVENAVFVRVVSSSSEGLLEPKERADT